uniref:Uncharacterized protein n=1 Tax=viral metagenome TaxID=1070528 RepID=A0A6C0D8X2_9ZZZZ
MNKSKRNITKLKRKRNKTRKTFMGKRRGGEPKVTDDELIKCNSFCNNKYFDMYSKNMGKDYKTNPYLKELNKTDKEIQEIIASKKEGAISDCKRVYCNPKCEGYGSGNKARYVCPVCEKKFKKVKGLGAITFCRYDEYL